MTDSDQTVSVPVTVLQRLRAGFLEERPVEGIITARREAVLEVLDYIPSPPKVGDVLTEEQIKALPPKSVLRDYDDDLWVTAHDGQLHLITFKRDGSLTDDDQEAYDAAEYSPVLVSLPTTRD